MTDLKKILSTTVFVFLFGIASCESHATCDCEYHKGGCVISVAPPAGFKCQCKYHLPLRCSAVAFPCVDNEHCPGNVADYCACKSGGGDCGGYVNPDTSCYGNSKPNIIAPATAECQCKYLNNGCTISSPAPFGWKCVCEEVGFQTCHGWTQGCGANEICLGDDFSYCACQKGGGDCDGYPEENRDSCTPSSSTHPSCNCDEDSNWIKGFYTVEKVHYDVAQAQFKSSSQLTLAEKVIPNKSDKVLEVDFKGGKNMTFTSSFRYEQGVEIQRSLTFEAGIPILSSGSTPISDLFTHMYGETLSVELPVVHSSVCMSAPYKITICTIRVHNGLVTLPYSMSLKHKIIPDCVCQSNGTWSGLQVYDPQFLAVATDDCNSNDCLQRTNVLYDVFDTQLLELEDKEVNYRF